MSADRVIYVGDGSSDVHVMLHVNNHDGFITIAVSEERTHARGLGQGADRPRADRRWAGVGAGNVDSAAGAARPAAAADFARGCRSRSAMMSAWRDPPWLVTGPRALEQHEIACSGRRTRCQECIGG